jgi:hypothetical protein
MTEVPAGTPFDQFMAAADAAARDRPEVDRALAREVFLEAATLIDNGLVLDGLDEHDTAAVVAGLCEALVADNPGDEVRARARAAVNSPGGLHDPDAASVAYSLAVGVLQL